jgi:hypothetical protein
LIDLTNWIFAVLAGRPNDLTYMEAVANAAHTIDREGSNTTFSPEEKDHRRGLYPAVSIGVSYGNGQTELAFLSRHNHDKILSRLTNDPSIQRLATFASCKFIKKL